MNYHILQIAVKPDNKSDSATVIFHISVPAINNDVSYSYRTAIREFKEFTSETGVITSRLPYIQQAELDQLKTGELIEEVVSVEYNADLSNAQKLNIIEAEYTARKDALLTKAQNALRFWGKEGDVA
jgi:hypothetical protein